MAPAAAPDTEACSFLECEGRAPAKVVSGELWKGEDSAHDDTVASAKNPDSPCNETEPLDEPDDFLDAQQQIALDASECHPEYINSEGEPLTGLEAVERYIEQRHGENTSANRHGFQRGRQWHDKRNYARGMEMDRQLLEGYDNPTTVMLSRRVKRTVPNRATLLRELSAALEPTLSALRDRLGKHTDSYQWLLVLAGMGQYATPHAHVFIWAEGNVPRSALEPVVSRFIESCEYAPSDGRGNSTEDGTISIRGTSATDTIPRTDDGESTGAVYALTQLTHLPEVDSMDFDELLWAFTVRATEGINHFRKSNYTVWDEDGPDTFDFCPNTALYSSEKTRFDFHE